MVTMNISLPRQMEEWIGGQTRDGRYADPSDLIRDLVGQAMQRETALAEMNAAIDQGLRSGIVEDYDPVERRRQLRQTLEAKRREGG